MFKIKEKPTTKKIEENNKEPVQLESVDEPVQAEEIQAQVTEEEIKADSTQDLSVQEVKVPTESPLEKKDHFDLAHLLGKTESGLKTEFYAYQIKELMKSVGIIIPRDNINGEKLVNAYKEALKYGVDEISITPYFYQACKDLERKSKESSVKFGTMIDYPYGESSFKARLADVKASVNNGLDVCTIVLPYSAITMGELCAEKSKLNKLCKAGKKNVGVAIKADFKQEECKKILKLIDGIKCSHITLLAEGVSAEKISEILKVLATYKFEKKVYVYSTIKTVEELSLLIESKVDKIYTPYLEEIGSGLTEKFGIKL